VPSTKSQRGLNSEQIRCLEEHKAYYEGLATHYAKQLEYVETLLQNGKDFAKSIKSQETPKEANNAIK